MGINKERFITNLCMGLFFFFSGVEYAVILPTLNGYLITMDAPQDFLGIVMSAFSLTGLIAAPIYGRITDRTGSAKLCVVIGNLFEIVGNLMYSVSSNQYMVLGARLIAGVGSGATSSIFGTISRTTTQEQRTAAFSLLLALRQIGLLVGPAFNIFLHELDFHVGPFTVDKYTSPGLLMAVIWALHTLILLIFYRESRSKTKPIDAHGIVNGISKQHYKEIEEESISGISKKGVVEEFVREEVVTCLAMTFMIMFSQTGLETAVTPVTLLFFGWDSKLNSFLFCGAGFVVICSFAILGFLSKKFSDRALLLAGSLGMVATYIIFFTGNLILYLSYPTTGTPPWFLPIFLTTTAMLTIWLPFVWVPMSSLFSKITSMETQAFNQGIRMVSMGLGQIMGPLWAASMCTRKRLPFMLGVDLFLIVCMTAMVFSSFKYMVPRQNEPCPGPPAGPVSDVNSETAGDENERSPLLTNGQTGTIN